jgi:hypothetical protein
MKAILTLADLLKANAAPGSDLVVEAITGMRPELMYVPSADPISGTEITLEVLTGLPDVAFRNFNEGSDPVTGEFTTRTFGLGILDTPVTADAQLVNRAKNRGKYLADRAMPVLEAALDLVCRQFWYGVKNDAKGFVGLIAQHKADAAHVVDLGGANPTSAWFLGLGRNTIEWIPGNGELIYMDPDWKEETLYDDNDKAFPGLSNWVHGALGMRLANRNKAVRVKGIGDDNGKTLTDDDLYAGLKLCNDMGFAPTHIFLNGRSAEQLRSSRTATNATGAPAPLPRDFEGIPLVISRFISNNETI